MLEPGCSVSLTPNSVVWTHIPVGGADRAFTEKKKFLGMALLPRLALGLPLSCSGESGGPKPDRS